MNFLRLLRLALALLGLALLLFWTADQNAKKDAKHKAAHPELYCPTCGRLK